jgi:hypothetical protein
MYIKTHFHDLINLNCTFFISNEEREGILASEGTATKEILGNEDIWLMTGEYGEVDPDTEGWQEMENADANFQAYLYEALLEVITAGSLEYLDMTEFIIEKAKQLVKERPAVIKVHLGREADDEERNAVFKIAQLIADRY